MSDAFKYDLERENAIEAGRPIIDPAVVETLREAALEGREANFEMKRAQQVSDPAAREVIMNSDKGAINDAHDFARSAILEQRQELWKKALWAALYDKERIGRLLYNNQGVWWPELGPLTPHERGVMLVEVRKMLGLPPALEAKR